MTERASKRKKWILWLGLILALVLLGVTVLLLLGRSGLSARYDAADQVTAGYDPSAGAALTLADDGTLTVRLTREDIYWYAGRYGVLDLVEERLAAAGADAMGFRLSDSRLTVYARCRTLGLLPLAYKATCSVRWDGSALVLTPERVWLGQRISLPEQRWPTLFSQALRLPMESVSPTVFDAYLDGDALVLRLEGLRNRSFGQLVTDRSLMEAMALFSRPETDEAVVDWLSALPTDKLPMDQARELCLAAEDVSGAITEMLACSTTDSVPSVWEAMDDFVRRIWGRNLSVAAAARRSELDAYLAGKQNKYEKLLSAVREMYKCGSLSIAENGFVSAGQMLDPGDLTSLSVTATDCRVVFLYAQAHPENICTSDMPCVDDVPRVGKKVMDEQLIPGTVYDLGVVLTAEGGQPVLLHARQDGSFALREISEALYVSILVERSNPVIDLDALPRPARELSRPSGEGWNGAVILKR